MAKIIVISGGFDPIHSGHIAYIKAAKALGDVLIAGLNSDKWLDRKKGNYFMPFRERYEVLSSIKYVDEVWDFNDNDNSAKDLILDVLTEYPEDEIIFVNGGDRTKENIPEMELLNHVRGDRLKFEFNIGGGDKLNSSSGILKTYKEKSFI